MTRPAQGAIWVRQRGWWRRFLAPSMSCCGRWATGSTMRRRGTTCASTPLGTGTSWGRWATSSADARQARCGCSTWGRRTRRRCSGPCGTDWSSTPWATATSGSRPGPVSTTSTSTSTRRRMRRWSRGATTWSWWPRSSSTSTPPRPPCSRSFAGSSGPEARFYSRLRTRSRFLGDSRCSAAATPPSPSARTGSIPGTSTSPPWPSCIAAAEAADLTVGHVDLANYFANGGRLRRRYNELVAPRLPGSLRDGITMHLTTGPSIDV